jgi:hypothetical protein
MAEDKNIPNPEQIEALTRAEQILKDQLEKQLNIRFKSNEEFRKTIELNKEYDKKLNDIEIALEGQLSLYNEINKQVQDFGKGLTDNLKKSKLQSNTQLGLKGIYSALNGLQGKLISNQENLLRGELSSNDITKDILKNRILEQNQVKISNDLSLKQTDLTNQLKKIIEEKNKSGKGYTEEQYKQKEEIGKQIQAVGALRKSLDSANTAQADITKELEAQLTAILAIEAKTGIAGKLLKGFTKIPILGDMLDIQGAQKAMNIAAANGASGFGTMLTGVKALGPSLKAALGPLGLILMAVDAFKALIGAMFDADKQVTSIARNLSVSKEVAADIRSSFNAIATTSGLQYNRLEDIIEAQIQLSELSKFTILYSAEALTNQVLLTKEIGLSASEAANLNKTFILNNKEGKAGTLVVEKQILSLAKQTGLLANGKKILQEVSKASGQILLNFRGNLPALTDAVLQADRLGISLSDARNISNSLLDFESSISNELEAGVFLGRRFNLEKARSLALQKNYVGATEEVLKQVGSIEEFEGMSAIHQQVIAKASGMTVDQLSDSLMYQKFLGIESEKNLKRLLDAGQKDLVLRAARGELADGELIKNLSALDAQEKFNIALDKAKEIFTSLITGGTLDDLSNILKSIVDSLASLSGQTAKFQQRKAAAEQKTIIENISTATPEDQSKLIKQLFEQKQKSQEVIEAKPGEIKRAIFTLFGLSNFVGIKDKYDSMDQAAKDAEKDIEGINTQLEKMGGIGKNTIQELEKLSQEKAIKEIGISDIIRSNQNIKDGYSDSSDGPFEITNKYGETAVTAVGDKVAVSPNMSFNNKPIPPNINVVNQQIPQTSTITPLIVPTQPTFNLTPMINAINEVRNAVATLTNKPTPQPTFVFQGNGAELGRFIGQYSELGTAQNINTAYLSS